MREPFQTFLLEFAIWGPFLHRLSQEESRRLYHWDEVSTTHAGGQTATLGEAARGG